jgi:mRNA-degrading endonuclease RelE of RelBE toxin-antitoxin system
LQQIGEVVFDLEITESARDDLRFLKPFEQRHILDAIAQQLITEPLTPARHRKPLRPNDLSTWELRVGKHRIFYDVEEENATVRMKAIGWKEHNRLFLRGKEYLT